MERDIFTGDDRIKAAVAFTCKYSLTIINLNDMKKFLIVAAFTAVFTCVLSCTQEADAPVAMEITEYTITESATFGDTVDFSASIAAGAVAQNLTAALVKDGSTLSSVTIREAENGVFSGKLEIPYTKNIEDGSYSVMFMAIGANSSDRAEKTVEISLSHPEFKSVEFISEDGKKYELTAEGSNWSCTKDLPASLSGYFEAKTKDDVVYTFGGNSIDNVEFGSTAAMELYKYDVAPGKAVIGFDVVTFAVTIPLNATYVTIPQTTDVANPGTVDVEFKKGQIVVFNNLEDLWVDIDFFDKNEDGSYTFRAEGGHYRLTNQADWGSLRTERITANGAMATFAWDESGKITTNDAIWCLGNYNFGKPDKREIRSGRQFSDWETYDAYCMAKIDDYKYQITLRIYNYAAFKFFKTKLDWGDIYGTNYDLANSTLHKIYILSGAGSDGNFQQGMSVLDPNKYEYPDGGIVLRFTFDVKDPLGIKVLVEEVTM